MFVQTNNRVLENRFFSLLFFILLILLITYSYDYESAFVFVTIEIVFLYLMILNKSKLHIVKKAKGEMCLTQLHAQN